jgi:hypothetical protein
MNKRQFLAAATLAAATPFAAAASRSSRKGPTLLTISGAIKQHNRGPLDPALDQMMHKQKVAFDAAYCFDYEALAAMPAHTIAPTLEYDGKAHHLAGPALLDILGSLGADLRPDTTVYLRAIDGYTVAPTVAELGRYHFILATHIDGLPLGLGGLGPLWAVYDADHIAELAAKPLNERFALCPWGIYHIEVKTA